MRKLFPATVLILAVILTGCITAQSIKAPRIALGNIRFLEMKGLVQKLQVDLLVANPNDFDIPLTGLQFVMRLNGLDFAHGLSNTQVTLPRLGEATVPVTISVSVAALIRQMQAAREATGLEYNIAGEVFLDHVLIDKVPFEKTGRLGLNTRSANKVFKPI